MAIRTGDEYRASLRDGREVYIDGEYVTDVTTHPAFKPIIDAKARMYDMQHDSDFRHLTTFENEEGEICSRAFKLPRTKEDLAGWRTYVETILHELGGPAERMGDETIGELWSLYDATDALEAVDKRFKENVETHVKRVQRLDLFHVSANTDPKGDRSKPPAEQDPDMLLRVVAEDDRGIVVRGAKYETAAAYANQAFVKPTIAAWDETMSEYAVGFICDMGAPGLKHICRSPVGAGRNPLDYPISAHFDEIDTLLVFDNVLIPWENVLFLRSPQLARYIRGTLHRYSAFPFMLRTLFRADLLIGAVFLNVEQTGLTKLQPVRDKLSQLIAYRETLNGCLIACVAEAQRSPGGLAMPNQSLLYAARIFGSTHYPEMLHIVRELTGGQISVTPSVKALSNPTVREYIEKFYTIGNWTAEDRIKLLHYTRDLVNSDYAGHKVTFQLFAQSPPFAHLAALYNNFDPAPMRELVRRVAGLGDAVLAGKKGA